LTTFSQRRTASSVSTIVSPSSRANPAAVRRVMPLPLGATQTPVGSLTFQNGV